MTIFHLEVVQRSLHLTLVEFRHADAERGHAHGEQPAAAGIRYRYPANLDLVAVFLRSEKMDELIGDTARVNTERRLLAIAVRGPGAAAIPNNLVERAIESPQGAKTRQHRG